MSGTTITIPTKDGKYTGYLAAPKSGSGPGIVMVQEIFGVNESMRTIADNFAKEGFTVLVPDLFWRFEPNIQLGYQGKDRDQAFDYYKRFDVKQGVADLGDAIDALRSRKECNGKIAILGFCLGGKLAYLTAAHYPVDAAVAFYGGGIQDHLDVAKDIKIPILFHFGDQDDSIPLHKVEKIKDSFKNHKTAEIHVYPGAGHAFYNHARDSFHKPSAAQAHAHTLKFLRHHLGG